MPLLLLDPESVIMEFSFLIDRRLTTTCMLAGTDGWVDVRGLSEEKVAALMVGPAGTSLRLRIQKPGQSKFALCKVSC
jgi:hypothetical protein